MSTHQDHDPTPELDSSSDAVVGLAIVPNEDRSDQIAGALGRNWGIVLSLGIVLAGLGAAVMVWPQATIGVVAVLLGVALLISGIFSLIAGLTRADQPTALRVLAGISGLLSLGLGIFALSGLTEAVTLLAYMIGFGWIVRGIADLILGIGSKGMRGRGLTIAAGVLGLLAGAVVLVWPSITLLALAYISGIWLIALGVLQAVLAMRLRTVATAGDLEQVLTR